MGLKKKLGMGIASAALGVSLIGGGTFAYFSDTADVKTNFTAGTLDLNANPTTLIPITNMKPGDWMNRSFELKNDGSLDIARVLLTTDYTVTNKAGAPANSDDFGKHIRVNFLWNDDKEFVGPNNNNSVIWSTTLDQLKTLTPDAVENNLWIPFLEENDGLVAGTKDKLYVQFQFVDNGDQNQFQGDSLELKWTFEGKQGAGVER